MEAGPWSGLPVAAPGPWGDWERFGGPDPGVPAPWLGCRIIFKRGVEVRTQGLREAPGDFKQPL